MSAALTAELRKLRATRTTTAAALGVLALAGALAAANVLLAGRDKNPDLDADTFHHVVRAPTMVLGFAMLVVGVLASAGEYRHNTIVPTLLAQPRRGAVVAAKLQAVALAGLVMAIASAAVSSAVGLALLASRDAPAADLGPLPSGLLVLAGTGVVYGLLGVGLGLLVRNQAVAMTAALVWWFVVERLAPALLREPHAAKYLPGGAADAFVRLGDPARSVSGEVTPWLGGVLLATYAVTLAGLATLALRSRDQT